MKTLDLRLKRFRFLFIFSDLLLHPSQCVQISFFPPLMPLILKSPLIFHYLLQYLRYLHRPPPSFLSAILFLFIRFIIRLVNQSYFVKLLIFSFIFFYSSFHLPHPLSLVSSIFSRPAHSFSSFACFFSFTS